MATGTIKGRTQETITPSIEYNNSSTRCFKRNGVVTVNVRIDPKNDGAASDLLCTIPQDYRPLYDVYTTGYQSGGFQFLVLNTSGEVRTNQSYYGNRWLNATFTFVQ